jgi:hypothetical protein
VPNAEYNAVLSSMFPSTFPKPILCDKFNSGGHCSDDVRKDPVCYSDFEPHFNTGRHFSELIVGPMKWDYTKRGENVERWITYGYNDTKWRYASIDKVSLLHVKISVGALGVVQFCFDEHSDRPSFYVSENTEVKDRSAEFVPHKDIIKWNSTRVESVCGRAGNKRFNGIELYGLPAGNHIVSMQASSSVTISHVIMFK